MKESVRRREGREGRGDWQRLMRFFLELVTTLKLYHWLTQSYSRHVSTDSAHAKMQELSDRFMEVYLGRRGRPDLGRLPTPVSVKLRPSLLADADVDLFRRKTEAFLLDTLPRFLDARRDCDLFAIRDEMLELLRRTAYLFALR